MTDRIDALLDDAVAAARLRADDGIDDGAATRLRLRESLSRRRGPRRIMTIVAAVIATLFGSTAFAYYVGGWRPTWVVREPVEPPVIVVTEPAAAVEEMMMPARTVRREAAPVEIEAEPLVVEAPKPQRTTTLPSPPPPPVVTPPVVVPSPDPELAAYRTAHEAHFRGGDPQAALAAWDAYLAKFPDGRLALEARYDRALVLVKLRRFADARAALQPFAEGTYRRAEAIKLLSAIQNR